MVEIRSGFWNRGYNSVRSLPPTGQSWRIRVSTRLTEQFSVLELAHMLEAAGENLAERVIDHIPDRRGSGSPLL